MTRKSFVIYLAVISVFMVGFFYFQLQGMQGTSCPGEWTWECDVYAQFECLGGEYMKEKRGANCSGGVCYATYHIWCDDPMSGGYTFRRQIGCTSSCGGAN